MKITISLRRKIRQVFGNVLIITAAHVWRSCDEFNENLGSGPNPETVMKYLKSLYVQVIIGMILGVLVGWRFPAFQESAKLISETFINMIKMVIAL